jgi:hypothetical protein
MATCPACRHHFRVLEDEDDGQHDCPHCGYSRHHDTPDEEEDDMSVTLTRTYERTLNGPTLRSLPTDIGWQTRHLSALANPNVSERPILALLMGWATYADEYQGRYDQHIGADYVLGKEWAAIGSALLGLLNGGLGRLDGGTLDGFLRNTLTAEGFDPETL